MRERDRPVTQRRHRVKRGHRPPRAPGVRPRRARDRRWEPRRGRRRPPQRGGGGGPPRGGSGGGNSSRTWTGGLAGSAIGGASRIDEREAFQDDFQLALLLVSVLVFPLIELEPALDEEGAALFHVLGNDLRLTAKRLDIHKCHLFFALTRLGLPGAVDRQADAG